MWLPPVGQHIVDDVPVSKRIVAQKGGAKMHMRPRPVDPQSEENNVIVKQLDTHTQHNSSASNTHTSSVRLA